MQQVKQYFLKDHKTRLKSLVDIYEAIKNRIKKFFVLLNLISRKRKNNDNPIFVHHSLCVYL